MLLIPQCFLLQSKGEENWPYAGKIKAGSSNKSHLILGMQYCPSQAYSVLHVVQTGNQQAAVTPKAMPHDFYGPQTSSPPKTDKILGNA